jgi:hypothetical protein
MLDESHPIHAAIDKMTDLGFKGITAIANSSTIPNHVPIQVPVVGLNGASNFSIFTLDATSTPEFNDFIYVSVEEGTENLLEAVPVSKAPQIYDDQAMETVLRDKFPGQSFEIVPGYFWEPCFELRSYLSVARRFILEGKEMFLLPNGIVINQLTKSDIGGT